MADVVAAMGVGVTIGAAAYTHAGGFVARHETVRSQQSTEIQQQVTNFEAAYERGEVRGRDWQEYRSIRAVARQKESEYGVLRRTRRCLIITISQSTTKSGKSGRRKRNSRGRAGR